MLRAYEGYLGGGQSTPARAEDFLDSYAIALTAGAEGESRSVLAGITEDGRLRSAMETGYRRGAELSKGKRLAQHLGSAGAAALEEHGYRYPEEFGAFYQAGQEGLSFPEAKRMAGVSGLGEVRKAVFTAAWEAGRKDGNDYEETSGYDLGFEENHGGNAVSLDRSERAGRMGAREPAQDLAGGAGKAEVSAKSLGITNGTDRKTARVLRDTELTDGMRGIRKDARERGLRVDFIRGSLELQVAGRTLNARGAQVGNRLIVQADNPSASFREIYRHERLHAQIARGDIPLAQAVEAVRRAIGMESWERMLPEYRKAYEGVYTGERFERNVQEELCADAAAGLLKGHGVVDLSGLEQGQKNSAPAERGASALLSVQTAPDGTKYTKIDASEIKAEGITDGDSIGKKARIYLRQHFRGVVLPVGKTKGAFIRSDGINEYTNPAKYLSGQDYNSKMLAATELDNMLKSSTYLRWAKDSGHHPEAVRGWNYYRTIFTVGDGESMRVYSGEVQIMRIARGDVFHDITKVKDVTDSTMGQDIKAHAQSVGNASENTVAQNEVKSQEGKTSIDVSARDSAGRELSAEQEYDSVDVDPYDVDPVNDITDKAKIKYLVEEFEKNGYRGRPVVALGSESEQSIALTGSHRILAAREAGIEIPVVYIEYDENNPLIQDLTDAQGDDERAQVAAELYEEGTISKPVYDLIVREEDLNYENYGVPYSDQLRYSVSEEAEPSSSAEYAQMQRGRAPAGPSAREAAEQRKRQVTLLSHMTERAFELRRQFTEGTQRDLRTTDIPDVASDLLRFAGRKAMGRGELEQRLSDIAMKAARSQNPMEAYQVAKEEADYLAADMMRNATGQTDEAKDMWDGIRQTLRSGGKPVKLAITGQSRADLEREGGYEHLRKRLMGYAFLSAGGTPVDVFYEQELTPRFPTAFPDTIQNPADQLIRIVEVLDRFRQIFKSPWAGDAAEDTELLSQERCLSFKKEWTGCEVPKSCIKMEMRAKYPSYFYNTLL